MQIEKLQNGLQLISNRNMNIHKVTLSLCFRGGPAYEPANYFGITHLVEHMMFRSLSGLTQVELYNKLRRIGTMMYGCTYTECVKFEISVIPENIQKAFSILNLIFNDQNWLMQDITAEKNVVIKQIEEKGVPGFDDKSFQLGFGILPWNAKIMGTVSSVKQISRKQLLNWQKQICSPANACFIISGHYKEEDLSYIKENLCKHISDTKPFPPFTLVPPVVFNRTKDDSVILYSDYLESDISISFDVPEDLKMAADYLYYIIGGIGSKLSMELREKLAFITDIDQFVYHYALFSRFYFVFTVDNEKIISCLNSFFQILKKTISELCEEDLLIAKEFLKKDISSIVDVPEDFCEEALWKVFILNTEFRLSFKNITLETLKNSALNIFNEKNLFVVVTNNNKICPKRKLENALVKAHEILKY